jgi:putative oxidoreductase
LIATDRSSASFVLRLVLALVMFPHGAQKVLGWFGGNGYSTTFGYFTGTLGVPALFTLLVFAAELLGPIGLLAGAFSRLAAAGLVAVMTGAIFMAHLPNGFFMNWTGTQAGEGYEYHLLVIGISLALVIAGSGRWSFDRWLSRRVVHS